MSTMGNGTNIFRFQGGFEGERDVIEVLSCETTRTDQDGWLSFEVDEEPKAWFDAQMLGGSGLCGRGLRPKVVETGELPKNETEEEEEKKSGAGKVGGFRSGWVATALGILGLFVVIVL